MTINFVNEDESAVIGTVTIDPNLRQPRLEYLGQFYEAAHLDTDGTTWVYRLQLTTK